MILDKLPSPEEFYKIYWGKKPFVVRRAIEPELFNVLIDGDSLAGLSLEEEIKSRILTTSSDGKNISCDYGPFDEDKFSTLGECNWNLLVQNVEQYHKETAQLLKHFTFCPRWLMDDIMVSYSTIGSITPPHTDNYHVFLVQGKGARIWKIGHAPLQNQEYIDGIDLKIMKHSFDGDDIEVSLGDVIYIPPNFGHEAVTREEAISFSIGFHAPELSELLAEYSGYLERASCCDKRYSGKGLDMNSSGFTIDFKALKNVQNDLIAAIKSDDFSIWLAEYFSTPTHDDIDNIKMREDILSSAQLLNLLQNGKVLHRQEHTIICITNSIDGLISLAAYGETITTSKGDNNFIKWLNNNDTLSINDIKPLGNCHELMPLITNLYNRNIFI